MAWCPKCKEEYEDHVEMCADCHVPLVHEIKDIETDRLLIVVKSEEEGERALEFLEYSGIKTASVIESSGNEFLVNVDQDDWEEASRLIRGFLIGEKEEVEAEDYFIDEYAMLEIEDNRELTEMKSSYQALLGIGLFMFAIGLVSALGIIRVFAGNMAYIIVFLGAVFALAGIFSKKKMDEKKVEHAKLRKQYDDLYYWYLDKYPLDRFESRHKIQLDEIDEGAKYFILMDLIVKEVKTNDQNAEEKMVNTVADKAAQEILALSHH
jgi:hypothetical protein